MRIAFSIFVIIHGLIHLMGFVKGFGIKDVKELTLPISKPFGLIWFIASILFVIYGILFFLNTKYAWLFGTITVVISQAIIFYFWKDAKFGTIPNAITFIVIVISLGSFLIKSEFTSRVQADFSNNNTFATDILTENDISHLPALVQEYLRYTKSVGQQKVKNFRAEFAGILRSSPDDKGMNVSSVQYNFYQNPSRYYYISATKMGLPATALHIYQNETATFQVKLLNWINVVDARGEKMNQGETVTLFNDMCIIAPATLIDKRIEWEVISDSVVKAYFTNGRIKISAELYFNEKHELVNFISIDRYETDGKSYTQYPWSTPVENYQMINGYLLPSKGKATYHKPDGDFTYAELEYKSVAYNLDFPQSD
ncbi:DUF6544 family protein [Fulvivirga lutimaris]|uniref:DUF6544 family protein n=1 Tax=Fulvivirga lutimaris TaxID=1819566 RepID=UPI001C88736D|nr:DUF6544 family protein [Fulvivirga lutimaris]MTI40576.1 hypothetical protein [Fulvivirga lutimaris]